MDTGANSETISLATIQEKLNPRELDFVLELLKPKFTTQDKYRERDEAIRLLLLGHAGVRPTEAAKRLERELLRYAASSWRHDNAAPGEQPQHDERRKLLKLVLSLNDGEPIKWRQIYNIYNGKRSG